MTLVRQFGNAKTPRTPSQSEGEPSPAGVTNPRAISRVPGLQGVSAKKCLTEGLSREARAPGWRRARKGGGQK